MLPLPRNRNSRGKRLTGTPRVMMSASPRNSAAVASVTISGHADQTARPDGKARLDRERGKDRAERKDGADGKIYGSRGDDEGHAEGEDQSVGTGFADVDHIVQRQKIGGSAAEKETEQQQGGGQKERIGAGGGGKASEALKCHCAASRSCSASMRYTFSALESAVCISAAQRPLRSTQMLSATSNT